MTNLHELPSHVFAMIESGVVANFATVSAKGQPIDTPTYYFPSDDMGTIDVATGVPNPAKAERARRNSRIGLLIEGRPDEPVVVVRAHAAVRDSDIQSNAIRYLAETGWQGISHGITWEQARLAITYWSRIIIENQPERIYWWDNHAALDGPPGVWNADPGTIWPKSDPAPETKISPGNWTARPWRDVAVDAMGTGHPAHFTVIDADGFPVPMRTGPVELVDEGFRLTMPRGMPWSFSGPACITFAGYRTFVGEASPDGADVLFRAERAMPQHPSTLDTKQVLQPAEEIVAKTRSRLEYEMARRGQPMVTIPDEAPERTRLARVRMARIASDSPITGLTVEHGNRTT
ncbi:MAG: pyridoxamine 5'-phosphate oxidase family protein [Novosphingobium sp.]